MFGADDHDIKLTSFVVLNFIPYYDRSCLPRLFVV